MATECKRWNHFTARSLCTSMAGILSDVYAALNQWATTHNPFYAQLTPSQISPDLLALIPFAVLIVILYLTGRGRMLAART